ncbi:hypothetical protein GJ496_009702 [Pomphorhynchus laevis]|nr:hypothetical protein GJ496_009702 [Pomphorhynchus laevis]
MSDRSVENEQILNLCGSGSSGFPDANRESENTVAGGGKSSLIHIRIQQRTGRKLVTTVQGIPQELDLKKINKYFRKTFSCLGTVVNHSEYGEVVQLSGDQRENVCNFLSNGLNIPVDQIKVHGF